MRFITILAAALLSTGVTGQQAPLITTAGQPAKLDIRVAGAHSLRITLKPASVTGDFPATPAVVDRSWPQPAISLRSLAGRIERAVGRFRVVVEPSPLRVTVRDTGGRVIQTLRFEADGPLTFDVGDGPVLGMGEGGPRPARGTPWREQPVQFDRRGALDTMEPRWQSDMYGSRNPAAVLFGTSGWGLFVATPWVQVDLSDAARGRFLPVQPPATGPQTERNQQQTAGKGLPPPDKYVAGLYDVFVFDAREPAAALGDFAAITGPAAMPPRWALGYMQSHRTLEDETQLLRIIDTFREKRIPLDAVIYLAQDSRPPGTPGSHRSTSTLTSSHAIQSWCWPRCTHVT
jgi:alpha-glucosidase/alpha-D-xyloside xylohydrolase